MSHPPPTRSPTKVTITAAASFAPANKKPRISDTNNGSNNTISLVQQLKMQDNYYCQRFDEYFQALVRFKTKHGHVRIRSSDDTGEFDPPPRNSCYLMVHDTNIPPPNLWRFSETLRRQLESTHTSSTDHPLQREPLLTPGRMLQLDCLQFPWKSPEEHDQRGETGWKQRYQELCQFHRQHGHCNIPSNHRRQPANTNVLYQWCRKQRDHYENMQTKFKLQAECERAAEQNNGVIPTVLLTKYTAASSKVLLTPEHFLDLYRLGFTFDKPKRGTDKWEEHYQKLVQFHKQHGHTRVSVYTHHKDKDNKNSDNDSLYSLAIWVKSQRRQHRLIRRRQEEGKSPGTLQFLKQFEARTKKLNALGFEWNASAHAVHSPAYQKQQQKKNPRKKASLKHDESSDNDDQDSESDNDYNNNHHNGRNPGHDQFHRFYTNYYS